MSDDALAELYERKAAAYRTFGNGVVAAAAIAALPPQGRLLDIGCASGGLLALLRSRAAFTAGLELSTTAAAAAAEVADQVVAGGIDDADLPFDESSFDVIVIADVLEHLVDPVASLTRAARFLRPGGRAVISVPNIGHWQARLEVLRGRWPQEETGTFDASHLRFFTVERLRATLEAASFGVESVQPVVPRLEHHVKLPGRLRDRGEQRWQALGRRRPNLLGYQLVGVGRR